MGSSDKKLNVIRALVYIALFAFFTYLFYLECEGILVSDMPAHIRRALEGAKGDYTILSPLFVISHAIAGNLGIAALLSAMEVATVYVCERLMRKLVPGCSKATIFVLALCCNVAIAVYVPFVHPYLTRGLTVGNQWHNSTYIGMRLVGLGIIWAYLRFVGYFESKNHVVDGIAFVVLVVLSAAIKPSLILSMGPALAILCVYDLVKQGTSTLKRSLVMAGAFVLAIAIVIPLQATALYGGHSGSGIGIGFFSVWRRFNACVPMGMLQSWAFPLIVLCWCVSIRYKDRNYQLTWAIFFVSLFIYAFLKETGHRKYHGNFAWGLNFADYYLMISAVCAYLKTRGAQARELFGLKPAIAQAGASEGTQGQTLPTKDTSKPLGKFFNSKAFDIVAIALFALHTLSGLISIGSILMGNGYA